MVSHFRSSSSLRPSGSQQQYYSGFQQQFNGGSQQSDQIMNALNAILHAQEAMVPAIERALQRILSVYGTPKQYQTEPGKYTTVPKVDEGINNLQCTYLIVYICFYYPYLTIKR
jgi:hypothetical protein